MRADYFTTVVLMIFFFGCSDHGVNLESPGPSGTPLTSAINGKNVACSPNQCFSLELDLNADGGYQWDHNISDTSILRLDSTNYRPKSGNWSIVGGLTVQTFYFRAVHPGQSTIDLAERQEWMKDVPPINTVRFAVIVR
jgi:predicted secreted protein